MEHNPYEAPASSLFQDAGDLAADGKPSTERDLRIFVRSNAEYYLRKWKTALMGTGSGLGFNWWAFLFSGIWLPYRKMYRIAFLYCGFFVLETIAEAIVVALSPGMEKPMDVFGRLLGIAGSIFVGMKGNEWYLAHARKAIDETRSRGLPDEEYQAVLARRGGASLLRGFGVFFLFILAIMVVAVVQGIVGGEFGE